MTDVVTFRTTDLTRWGTGQNSRLSKTEIDINFWALLSRVTALEDHALVASVGISSFYIDPANPTQFYVNLTDSTRVGPYTLPQQSWNFTNPPTGAWVPSSGYSVNDVFLEASTLYVVTYPHTSASTFDPGANDGHGHSYYKVLLDIPPIPVSGVTTTTYTPTIADANTYIRMTNASGCVFTIPSHSSVPFPLFTEFTLRDETGMTSSGVTIDALSPAHINPVYGYLNSSQTSGATIGLKQVAIDSWDIMGLLLPH